MNVLHVIDNLDYGGAQQVVVDLVLASKKVRPLVCSLNHGPLVDVLRRKGVETLVIEKKRSFDFGLIYKFVSLIRRRKIDLIHTHLLISDIYGWMAAKLAGVPNVITVHGIGLTNFKYGRRAFRFISQRSAGCVVVSRDMKKSLARILDVDESLFQVIYNGVNSAAFSDNGHIGASGDSEAIVVGSVGTLRPVKGYEYLIRAAKSVHAEMPNVKFVIAGDGPLRGELESLAQSLDLGGCVTFLGFRSDISDLLKTFRIFALSSLTEGVSISILEAMAAGKPVIATDVGGNSEVVDNGRTGILTPSQDPKALAEAIIRLVKDPELMQKFGEEGRERVQKLFSLEAMTEGYQEIYSGILEKKRA